MKNTYCTIYLVRHGETEWNVKKLIQGQKDIPLNKKGEDQAMALGKKLKKIKFDAIYSSDLRRAAETAIIIAGKRRLMIIKSKALRERYFGKFQGELFGDSQNKSILELINRLKSDSISDQNEIESDELIISRLIPFLRKISLVCLDKTILVVSHGGTIRTLLILLGWGTYENLNEGCIDNLAYVKLESDGVDFLIKKTSGIKKLLV
ncbi:MAG: histidine phosphatase family protein [Patescibacteria group bacterium]